MTEHKTAVLFPGQGSQEKNMGRSLAEKDDQAMYLWKKAEKISGHPLREVFWDGNQDDMSRTDFLQPALTVTNLNLWFFFRKKLQVQAMAGHSLGEYCALCCSGVLDLDQTLKLVSLRGRLMAEAGTDSEGAMAAVLKLEQNTVEELTRKITRDSGRTVVVANYNTPGQFVVSGNISAIKTLGTLVSESKGRLIMLPVSGAFHSPLMEEAALELAGFMEKMEWKRPSYDVYFNSTADSENNPEKIMKLMQKQMTSPVYFIQEITKVRESGINTFVELGPRGVLTGMIPRIIDHDQEICCTNIACPEDEDRLRAIIK